MLVITAKVGEPVHVYLGEDLLASVTLVECEGSIQARVGFDLDERIVVLRHKLALREGITTTVAAGRAANDISTTVHGGPINGFDSRHPESQI